MKKDIKLNDKKENKQKNANKTLNDNSKIRTEAQKKKELFVEKNEFRNIHFDRKLDNTSKNIILTLIILVVSIFSCACVVLSGNLTTNVVKISANESNTRIVQARLSSLGYFAGDIDGIYD